MRYKYGEREKERDKLIHHVGLSKNKPLVNF